MTSFHAVNTDLALPARTSQMEETMSPTTPRPRIQEPPSQSQDGSSQSEAAPFGKRGMAAQRPLPSSPFPNQAASDRMSINREGSYRSEHSSAGHSIVDDSDSREDLDGSGNESSDDETERPSKKKKGQKFFCTDYPPCSLSFTRSEHLARHIRYEQLLVPFLHQLY